MAKTISVTAKLTREQVDALDKLIKKGKFISRSEALRSILKGYLEGEKLL